MTFALLLALLLQDSPPEIKENIEVTYRQIQLRVQDRESEPVKGLKIGDFVFRRNGEVLVPESFIEVDETRLFAEDGEVAETGEETAVGETELLDAPEGEMEEPVTPRAVAILLDPGMSSPKGFQVMRQTAWDLIDRLPPHTKISVYQMHFSLRNLVTLTENREMIKTRIDEAVYFSDLWNKLESLQRGINMSVVELNSPKFGSKLETRTTGTEENSISAMSIAQLNQVAELLKFKGRVKDMYTSKISNALGAIGKSLGKYSGDRQIYMLTGGGYIDDTNVGMLKAVTSRLNWENIPIHSLHFRDRETKDLNLVRMTRLTEQDLKDMQNNLWRGGLIEEGSSINTLNEDEGYLKSAPRTYSRETGGTFVSAFNPLQVERQLGRVFRGASHYYLVSYRTVRNLDRVDIEMKTPIKGVDVFYGRDRGNFVPQLSESKSEKLLDFATTLLYGFEHHDTEISWEFEHFINGDGTHSFPVVGRLSGDFPKKGYELGMIALDERGEIMDDRKSEILKPGKNGSLAFYDLLVTAKKPTYIRAMIQEKKSGKSSLAQFEVGKNVAEGACLSTLVMIPAEQQEVFAIHVLQKERVKLHKKKKVPRQKLDPLFKGPSKMIPPGAGAFALGQPIGLYFHAQQLEGAINNYDLESVLSRDDQKLPVTLRIGKVEVVDVGAALMASMDTSRLEAGHYLLALRLKDKRTGALSPYSEQAFEIQ